MTLDEWMRGVLSAWQLLILFGWATVLFFGIAIFALVSICVPFLWGKSNCILYAYQGYRNGDYVVLYKTRHARRFRLFGREWAVWRWPHACRSRDGRIWFERVPFEYPARFFPPLLHRGYVREATPFRPETE
jgi:hypothetical protein